MDRRERLENTVAGNPTDRVPAALWRHFPGDDQRVADFAEAIVAYQLRHNWDLLVIQPASAYPVVDQGISTTWDGDPSGDRTITHHPVQRSLDWTELRSLDPQRGELGKQLAVIGQVTSTLNPQDHPVIMTVYSPLSQAARLAGASRLRRDLRLRPDRLHSALNVLTENTLRFMQALARTPITGIRYVTEHADHTQLSEAEYGIFGLPYDTKLFSELADHWWFNLLSIQGELPMFQLFQDTPAHAVQWRTTTDQPSIPQGKSLIRGAVCGGLNAETLYLEEPTTVRAASHNALAAANRRRLILSADSPVPVATPLSNIRAISSATQLIAGGT
jgi:uroporphyrinogen decarboxylase